MFDWLFFTHPRSVGETYVGHSAAALGFAGRLFTASMACLIHAVVPGFFQRTASRIIEELHSHMVINRRRAAVSGGESDYAI